MCSTAPLYFSICTHSTSISICLPSEPEIPDIVEEEEKEDTEIVAAQQNGADEAGAAVTSPGADSKASPKGMCNKATITHDTQYC